jgi:hypothetical protein
VPPLPPANRNDFSEKPVNENLCKEELDNKDGFKFDRTMRAWIADPQRTPPRYPRRALRGDIAQTLWKD